MTMLSLQKSILAAAIAAAPLSSQAPANPAAAFANAPSQQLAGAPTTLPWPDRVLTDVVDGTPWASAENWKASFTASGATFYPFLGSDAPGCSATFGLGAARCAGEPLPLQAATPVLRDRTVSYERGAVRELFTLGKQGVEHSFVFETLPTRGELLLDVAVASSLAPGADDRGHTLLGDHGGVRYGLATAFDASGRSCDLTTQFVDGALRIAVPAAFVASAVLPLVVDPLIGTISTLNGAANKELLATDIAYDQSLHRFFVAYERAFSATDHDIYVIPTDESMAPQGLVVIDITTEYWARPRIAALEAHDTLCIVSQTSIGNVSPFSVKVRLMLGGPSPLVQPAIVFTSNSYDYLDPDVGGDADPNGPTRFLLAFEKLTGGSGQNFLTVFTMDSFGATQTAFSFYSTSGRMQRPAISKTCGKPGNGTEGWGLVHRFSGLGQTLGELRFAIFDRNGSFRSMPGIGGTQTISPITPNAGSEWDVSSPTDE